MTTSYGKGPGKLGSFSACSRRGELEFSKLGCSRGPQPMRFMTIAAVAAVATLTACTESMNSLPSRISSASCPSRARQGLSSVLQSATAVPQRTAAVPHRATATQLGLWPRRGPSVRVCGDVGAGFARCQAWLRTDIRGAIQPDTPGGYAPGDLQTAYGLTSDSESSGGGSDRCNRRGIRRSERGLRSQRLPLAVRAAGMHFLQRMLYQADVCLANERRMGRGRIGRHRHGFCNLP